MPVISRVVSPSKPSAPAMPSHAPEANPVNLNSKGTSKPISSVAIHSRCCCRHHKQGDGQKATLKSRSSDSLTKEVLINLGYFLFCFVFVFLVFKIILVKLDRNFRWMFFKFSDVLRYFVLVLYMY